MTNEMINEHSTFYPKQNTANTNFECLQQTMFTIYNRLLSVCYYGYLGNDGLPRDQNKRSKSFYLKLID